MVGIVAFPTIRNVLVEGDNIVTFISGGTIKAGMVVAFAAAGGNFIVLPAIKATTGQPIGVALHDALITKPVAVAMDGCIVNVVDADDTTDLDAGDIVEDNVNAIGGTVSAVSWMDAGVLLVVKYQVGIMLDITLGATTGGGIGRMLVSCGTFTAANNA
jgi:hypothetical protein